MRASAWNLVLGLSLTGLACTTPTQGVARPVSAPRNVQTAVEDSVFAGVRLPPPMVDQLVDNDIFDAAGAVRPGADTTLSFALPVTSAMTAPARVLAPSRAGLIEVRAADGASDPACRRPGAARRWL